jgi:hypothetical protein
MCGVWGARENWVRTVQGRAVQCCTGSWVTPVHVLCTADRNMQSLCVEFSAIAAVRHTVIVAGNACSRCATHRGVSWFAQLWLLPTIIHQMSPFAACVAAGDPC